jgi:hypothetical protein
MLSGRLNRGYVKSLERGLADRASYLRLADSRDSLITAAQSPEASKLAPRWSQSRCSDTSWLGGQAGARLGAILCGDASQVKRALDSDDPLERPLVPFVVPLLGWNQVSDSARRALSRVAPQHIGQFADWLLDPTTDPAVRRRLPRVLANAGGVRAIEALLLGLEDERFEVRVHSARALESLKKDAGFPVDLEPVYAALRRELSRIPSFTDRARSQRTIARLEHVFGLLAVVLPREPVRIAYRAVQIDDTMLYGLALEYLQSALPTDIGDTLIALLDTGGNRPAAVRSADEIKEALTEAYRRSS